MFFPTKTSVLGLLIIYDVACTGQKNNHNIRRRRNLIVNGGEVNPSNAKWFVKSGKDSNDETADYLCGATLIHDDMLLTAAHCQGAFNYGLFLYDQKTNDYTREATVDLQLRHPDFNGYDKHNDLMILRLSSDPGLPILKMNGNDSIPRQYGNDDSEIMKAYGFGKTASNDPKSNVLREGHFRYLSNKDCAQKVKSTRTKIWDDVLCGDSIYNSDIAVGRNNYGPENDRSIHGICQGDSGGALTDSSGTLLLGVVSWTFLPCEVGNLPDGFTRVAYFQEWITKQICFYSRKPLSSNNICTNGTSPPLPPLNSVEILLKFKHDFYPEETFIRILSKDRNNEVEFSGPQYVPDRATEWVTRLQLLPGEYTLEILDIGGNGLSGGTSGKAGSWQLVAIFAGDVETELASSRTDDNHFESVDLVDFTVEKYGSGVMDRYEFEKENDQLEECFSKKFEEEQGVGFLGITCDCKQKTLYTSLHCFDTMKNKNCIPNRGNCSSGSYKCCGNRRCSNGVCRPVTQGREYQRIPLLVTNSNDSAVTLLERGSRAPHHSN